MRIAVITDVHANILALEAICNDLENQNIDEVAFPGDLVMNGPRPKEVYELVEKLNPKIWLQGNTDNWLEEIDSGYQPTHDTERRFYQLTMYCRKYLSDSAISELLQKPIAKEHAFNNSLIAFCHGSPLSFSQHITLKMPEEELMGICSATQSSVICSGHTHRREFIRYRAHTLVNFGAASIPLGDHCPWARYGIIEIHGENQIGFFPKEVAFDIESFFKDMEELDFPGIENIKEKYGYGKIERGA